MTYVALLDAARHLKLDTDSDPYWELTDEAQDLTMKLGLAEGVVLDYLKNPEDAVYWDEDLTPAPVQASVLLVLSDLWEHRAGAADDSVFISKAIKDLLRRWRDPALA